MIKIFQCISEIQFFFQSFTVVITYNLYIDVIFRIIFICEKWKLGAFVKISQKLTIPDFVFVYHVFFVQ